MEDPSSAQPRFVLDTDSGLDVSFQYGSPAVTHHVHNTGAVAGYAEVAAWVDGYEVGRQQVWAEVQAFAMFAFALGELYPGPHRLDVAVTPPDESGTHALQADFEVAAAAGEDDARSVPSA